MLGEIRERPYGVLYLYRNGGLSYNLSSCSIITFKSPVLFLVILIFSISRLSTLHCAIFPKRSERVRRVDATTADKEELELSSEPEDSACVGDGLRFFAGFSVLTFANNTCKEKWNDYRNSSCVWRRTFSLSLRSFFFLFFSFLVTISAGGGGGDGDSSMTSAARARTRDGGGARRGSLGRGFARRFAFVGDGETGALWWARVLPAEVAAAFCFDGRVFVRERGTEYDRDLVNKTNVFSLRYFREIQFRWDAVRTHRWWRYAKHSTINWETLGSKLGYMRIVARGECSFSSQPQIQRLIFPSLHKNMHYSLWL